jgi:DNA-binding response OmpR family regulator
MSALPQTRMLGQAHRSTLRTADTDPKPEFERLLIVDDDTQLCEVLRDYLHEQGFELECVHRGLGSLQRAESGAFSLIILDIMLPDQDGFDLLKSIRQRTATPILILSGRGGDVDRIVGLELGADDYLAKPFNPRELVARIRAILRRARRDFGPVAGREPPVIVGDIHIDPGARIVKVRDRIMELTSAEFDLLDALVRSAGQAVSREVLSRNVFGRRLLPEDRSIDVHISNLRRKLTQAGGADHIKTLRGTGYIYTLPMQYDHHPEL